MTEVQLLQVIGLTVVGVGAALLLFVKARFIRVVAFVSMVLGAFSLVALGVPQMASLPPAVEKFDVASIKDKKDLAAIGQKIFFGKGQCALCHTIGSSEGRCPDLKGVGAFMQSSRFFRACRARRSPLTRLKSRRRTTWSW